MVFVSFLTCGSTSVASFKNVAGRGLRDSFHRTVRQLGILSRYIGTLISWFHLSSPVLPSFEWLLITAQAVANWDSITKQSGGIVSSAQLSHPWEIPVSVFIIVNPWFCFNSSWCPSPLLFSFLLSLSPITLVFSFSEAIWKASWRSLLTLLKRTRLKNYMTCWGLTCCGGSKLMYSRICHPRQNWLCAWSWALCRSECEVWKPKFSLVIQLDAAILPRVSPM